MLCAAGFGAPSHAKASCVSGKTLHTRYGLLVSGATTTGVPKYLDGTITFNGACGLTGTVTIGEPGVPSQNFASIAGTYNTQKDGTIWITLSLPNVANVETYVVGFSKMFGEALGEETDSSAIATIDLKPQNFSNPSPQSSYSNADLAGAFTASCYGMGGGFSDLNYFSFDGTTDANGVGNITGVDDSNNNAEFYDEPYIGSYAVLPDGSFGGNVTVAGTNYGYSGVLDNNRDEVQYVFTRADGTAFVGCTAKRVLVIKSGG